MPKFIENQVHLTTYEQKHAAMPSPFPFNPDEAESKAAAYTRDIKVYGNLLLSCELSDDAARILTKRALTIACRRNIMEAVVTKAKADSLLMIFDLESWLIEQEEYSE